jgi:hypothetical protein
MQAFAARVQGAVEAEIDANLEELYASRKPLGDASDLLGEAIAAEDVSKLEGQFVLQLPDFSSAAWNAAQASQAAPHLDYAWMIDVGRAYEAYGIYSRISDEVIRAMTELSGDDSTTGPLRSIRGRLNVLLSVHDQLTERLEDVQAEPDDARGADR